MRRLSRDRSCERVELPPEGLQLALENADMTSCFVPRTPRDTREKDEPSRCGSPSRVRQPAKLTEEQRESIRTAQDALFAALGDRFWEDKKLHESEQRKRAKTT